MDSEKTVAELITRVEEMLQSSTANVGIFFSKYGMWLDEKLCLFNYNFDDDNQLLEYRTRADQVLVRIYISTYELTFAIKVLPSQRTAGSLFLIVKMLRQL
jgi:mevalonate kinase